MTVSSFSNFKFFDKPCLAQPNHNLPSQAPRCIVTHPFEIV